MFTRTPLFLCGISLTLLSTSGLHAQSLTLTDGASPSVFNNGGGTGFGGTLGNGSLSFDVVGSNLNISFTAGSGLNDIVTLYLDTKPGGITEAQMNDTADGGRFALSNLTRDVNDVFPIQPDYGIAIGSFGAVLFELTVGNTPNHLNFVEFNAAPNLSITLTALGITPGVPTSVDFFAAYVSASGFASNETLPASSVNSGGNPGFGSSEVTFNSFNRFVTAAPVPEPATYAALAGLCVLGAACLRRRAR